METCRAFVYAGIEDFGIAPVEAMAAGAPIIALKKAGILDTVQCINSKIKSQLGFYLMKKVIRLLEIAFNTLKKRNFG